jgi:hypothetical protein
MDAQLNYLAVLVASLSTFLIGGLWYSPAVFGKAVDARKRIHEESLKGRNMATVFGLAFLLAVIAAVNLAMFMGLKMIPPWGPSGDF